MTHRTQYDLEKAEDRAHVLEGLVKALNILDEVIAAIKASKNRQDAQNNLEWMFGFTERQADSILTLQLYRLTNLEITTLQKELDEIQKKVAELRSILESDRKLISIIRKELKEIREKYGIERRSSIQEEVEELKVNLEVLVNSEDVLVTLSNEGYIKRTSKLSFTRSGGDRSSSGVIEGDVISSYYDVNTLDNLLVFTQRGQYYLLPVHQVPEFKWKDPGTAIVNVIPLSKEDRVVTIIPVRSFEQEEASLVFVTRRGQIKRTALKDYVTKRSSAVAACKVGANDEVIRVHLSTGGRHILLVSKLGQSVRFLEDEVNTMGRVSGGVKGIQLKDEDELVTAVWVDEDEGEIFTITDLGYGKRSLLLDYPLQSRGGKGVATFEFKEGKRVKPNGSQIVAAYHVKEPLRLLALTDQGKMLGFSTESAPISDKRSTGKALVSVEKNDSIVQIIDNRADDTSS